jgi:hypothetical protein
MLTASPETPAAADRTHSPAARLQALRAEEAALVEQRATASDAQSRREYERAMDRIRESWVQTLGEYVRQLAPAPTPRTVAQEVADLLR